jgi:hypothetical protein
MDLMSSVTTSSATLDRRWLVLVVVALAQLMLVLDATIVNIALPSAQQALGFSDSERQWVVTAYALAFGSLLLVGGRLGDMFSRKAVLITGLVGFVIQLLPDGAQVSFIHPVPAFRTTRTQLRLGRAHKSRGLQRLAGCDEHGGRPIEELAEHRTSHQRCGSS